MRIGFDAKRIVNNGTGLGNYGRTLVNSLANAAPADDFLLYAPNKGRDELRGQIEPRRNVCFKYHEKQHFYQSAHYWRSRGIVNDLVRDHVDIYHGLTGELPMGLSKTGIKGIVTIHDLIFMHHPEYYNWIDVQIYKAKFHKTLREASRVIAISECTKRDIMRYSDYPEDKIDVVYQSCDTRFKASVSKEKKLEVKQRYHLPDHFVLQVGTIEPRKNALLTAQALRHLPNDFHLVLVGRQTSYAKQIKEKAPAERILFLTNVPNDDLYAIYQQAACFAYPSTYEGFGIPIIEAIQSGLPVVAATGSCLEEAGGPDCLYVNPGAAPPEMAENILTAIQEKDTRTAKSQAYASRFENQDIAQQMISCYNNLLNDMI